MSESLKNELLWASVIIVALLMTLFVLFNLNTEESVEQVEQVDRIDYIDDYEKNVTEQVNGVLDDISLKYDEFMQQLKDTETRLDTVEQQLETIQLQLDEYRISFTNEELEHLLMLVQHESGGESYDCQLWVASVIVNRVLDERYPDTLWEVIYDTSPVRQFTPTAYGLYKEPSESVRKAVREALKHDYTEGCWIFNNASLTDDSVQQWFDQFEIVASYDDVQFRR